MKKLVMLLLCSFIYCTAICQFGNILDRAKQKTKDKVNQKVDQKMDKAIGGAIDSVDNTISGKKAKSEKNTDKKGSNTNNETLGNGNNVEQNNSKSTYEAFKSYSKFDFVPGAKIIAAEDFSQDEAGDFPAKWNTNGSGEIVTTNKQTGKFLITLKDVVFYPEWIRDLPDNFTLEFDLMCTDKFSYYSGYFVTGFTTALKVGDNFRAFARFGDGRITDGGGFEVAFHPENAGGTQGLTSFYSSFNEKEILKNDADQDKFSVPQKSFVHISIWRQKTRVRVYMDDKKVWDLPKAVAEGLRLNSLYFRNNGSSNDDDAYYLANIRLAIGTPDTRNKLITEGKFVTHGILFDVNSNKIKPESYGVLKDIAAVLNENTTVKVKITGHTDADGDDESNLLLSKKRAEAVRNILTKEFGIDAFRMSADGKGESQPVDTNTTPAGKANNRRVEFIKE